MGDVIDMSEKTDKLIKVETVEKKPEEVDDKLKVVDEAVPAVRNAPISELEFQALSKTFNTIRNLKEVVKVSPNQAVSDQINLLEVSIWDDLVKKFNFTSVEAAQSAGYSFSLKVLHVIECKKV